MDVFTHLCISSKLKRIIEKEFHVRINTASFLLGSIKPDLSSKYLNIPHYKKDSEDFIQEEIRGILDSKIYECNKCTSNFSERLGIITHYLSDFFCYAHSEYFTGNMLKHYVYEMRLFINYIKNSKEIIDSCYDKNIVTNHNVSSICSYIDDLHREYSFEVKEASPSTDMTFTFNACISLCFSIITECMVSEENFSNIAHIENIYG
ncbi:MAG TPA: zinc dependent phospholipase C family protein [Ruminiclostridium sp.]